MLLNKSLFSLWHVFDRLFYSFSAVDFFLIGSSVFKFLDIYDSFNSFVSQSHGFVSDTFSDFLSVYFLSLPLIYYFNDLSYLGTLESIFCLSFEP